MPGAQRAAQARIGRRPTTLSCPSRRTRKPTGPSSPIHARSSHNKRTHTHFGNRSRANALTDSARSARPAAPPVPRPNINQPRLNHQLQHAFSPTSASHQPSHMSSSHSRTPSTPLGRSASFASKFINKLRTPSGSSPALGSANSKQTNYSQSSLASASSSQSSFRIFTGFQNGSKSTLNDDDDDNQDEELDFPEFPTLDTSPFKPKPDSLPPAMLGTSNPFSSAKSRSPNPAEDEPTIISRQSSTLDRGSPPPSRAPSRQAAAPASAGADSAYNGSGSSAGMSAVDGSGDRMRRNPPTLLRGAAADKASGAGASSSLGRTWAKGRDLISRSPSVENSADDAAGNDVESLSEVLRATAVTDVSSEFTHLPQGRAYSPPTPTHIHALTSPPSSLYRTSNHPSLARATRPSRPPLATAPSPAPPPQPTPPPPLPSRAPRPSTPPPPACLASASAPSSAARPPRPRRPSNGPGWSAERSWPSKSQARCPSRGGRRGRSRRPSSPATGLT